MEDWCRKLDGLSGILAPVHVKVANCEVLSCSLQLLHDSWLIKGYSFISNFKVLDIPHFDLILGTSWLE